MIGRLIKWFKREGESPIIECVTLNTRTNEIKFTPPRWHIQPMFAWVRPLDRRVHRHQEASCLRVPDSMPRDSCLLWMQRPN